MSVVMWQHINRIAAFSGGQIRVLTAKPIAKLHEIYLKSIPAGLYDGTTHPLFKVAIVLHNGGNLAGAKRGAMNTVDPALWLIWIVALMIVFLFPGVFKVD